MEYVTSLINSYFPEPHASLVNGIILGQKLQTTRTFYEQLKTVGLIHIVVLSGMNITMLSAFILQLIVPMLGRKIATICTIVSIIVFIYFVGIEPPIVRAAIMGILSLIGLLFGRKTLAIYTLILTAIICIIIWPDWLTSISFQLSFGATLGIILFGNVVPEENTRHPEVKPKDQEKSWMFRFAQHDKFTTMIKYLTDELRITFAAQLFTVPLIFIYFRQISFISPIANILVGWLIAPIMVIGIVVMVVGSLNWQLGFIISWLCYGMIQWIIWVVEWLAKIPYASVKIL